MERIKSIWSQIESNVILNSGLFTIRYLESSTIDVFLGVKFPEMYRMLILRLPIEIGKEFNLKYEFKGLKFEKIYDPDDSKFLLFNLVVIDKQFHDIFDSLLFDLISSIIQETEIQKVLKIYSNRIVKWQGLFERYNTIGLSPEEQRGMWGELYFLRKFLLSNTDIGNVVNSWLGPEKQIRDFQYGNWAVEIKTTSGNNHQKVHVRSERQLDCSGIDILYLFHLSLDIRNESGETLNEIIESLYLAMKNDYQILNQFKNKLMIGGYFDHHKQLYDNIGYFIREASFYLVEGDFPRIEEADIRPGVGDVNYSIILSQCFNFKKEEIEVFSNIIFNE